MQRYACPPEPPDASSHRTRGGSGCSLIQYVLLARFCLACHAVQTIPTCRPACSWLDQFCASTLPWVCRRDRAFLAHTGLRREPGRLWSCSLRNLWSCCGRCVKYGLLYTHPHWHSHLSPSPSSKWVSCHAVFDGGHPGCRVATMGRVLVGDMATDPL